MRQGIEETVTVRISRNQEVDILENWPGRVPRGAGGEARPDANPVRVEPIKVSGAMEVELVAADSGAFSIQPPGPQRQAIVGDYAEFSWFVTPLEAGRHVLRLQVSAEVPTAEGDRERKIEVKDAEIDVEVNPRYVIGRFWSENWQWVLGSPLVLGLFGWLAKRFGAMRRTPPASES